jgi:hypothetical protein
MTDDIRFANTLAEVQEIRKRQVEAERAGGDHDGIQRILTEDMYSNPLRFIDELLQNAQDAARKAAKNTDVEFKLYNDKLEFSHSGKDFDLKDVIGITGIGVSTKTDQDIGTFGIGFKSVYQITDEPHIYSGKYNFKIVDFRIPTSVPKSDNIKNTAIILPFKKDFEQDKLFSYLNEIEIESLLFLPNIDSITWNRHDEIQQIPSLSKFPLDEFDDENLNYKKIEITNISSDKSKQYLVFQRNIQISNKTLDIEIAFGFDPVENRIIPLMNRKLHVFFPTTEETHLSFLLNAPFRTTANREKIKLENDDDFKMIEELSQLTADSILFIKKHFPDLLDVTFYSKLIPIKGEEQHSFYRVFFMTIKALLKNPKNRLLPIQNSDFASANNVLLAENLSLMELLNVTDNKQLFGKKYWVNSEITATKERTKELHRYLKEHLDVEDIGFEQFAKVFAENFIEAKTDQWIIRLYRTLLSNQKRLWEKHPWEVKYSWQNQTDGIWKGKPIIRLSNGKHVAPYDRHGNRQAWLPSESESYFDTVKSTLIEDKEAKEFLEKIGLEKPDLLAEFKKYIAPRYEDESPRVEIEKYLQDISMAIETYREYRNQPEKKGELVNTIKSLYFIKAQNAGTGNKLFKKPNQVSLPTKELEMWFQGNGQAHFVDEKIRLNFINKGIEFKEFFSAIGVSNEIRFIEQLNFNMRDYYCENYHKYGKFEPKDFRPDFDIEGLNYSLDNINMDRSKVIWKIALIKSNHITTCKVRSAKFQRSLDGQYDNKIPSERPKEKVLESIAGKLLKEKHWLYDRQGNLIQKPISEISLDDLHYYYDKGDDNVNKLVKALRLRPETFTKEEVNQIVYQKDKKIRELETRLYELERAKIREKPRREYVLEELRLRDVPEPTQLLVKDKGDLGGLEYQTPGIGEGSETNGNTINDINGDSGEGDAYVDKKEYGRWAEEYVVKQLHGKYEDKGDIIIEWLNEKSETGIGCDIIIKKDNQAINFIEVKGKVSNKPEFFEVTEMQFKFANEKGEKYFFYVVSNIKSKDIKIEMVIQDPIKAWREDRLIASPIRFKI